MRSTSSIPTRPPGRRGGRLEEGAPGRGDGRRPPGVGPGGHEADVDGLGPRPDEHRPVADAGPAGLGQRADHEGGRLVRAQEGGHALGVGLAHDAVVGGRAWRSRRPCAPRGTTRTGWPAATSVNGRHQLAQGGPVGGGVAPGPGGQHVLEQRVDVHRGQQRRRPARPDRSRAGRRRPRDRGPGRPRPSSRGRPRARRARDDRMASAPAMSVTVRLAGGDLGGRPVDQPLRGVAADGRDLAATSAARPSRSASSVAGAGPTLVMTSTTVSRSIRSRRRGTSARADSQARVHQVDRVDELVALEGLARGDDDGDALGVGGGWRHGGCPGGSGAAADRVASRGGKLPSPPCGGPGGRGAPYERGCGRASTRDESGGRGRAAPRPGPGPLPDGFLFGVATAGFQIEGGFNGPGQPANNWLAWEQVGRVAPSGDAVDFWRRPEEALDRAAALGCDSFRLGVEWARVDARAAAWSTVPRSTATWASWRPASSGGLTPLVTLHHFTHPAWLGEDLWLRPDAAARFARLDATWSCRRWHRRVRHWVTLNEINVLALDDVPARGVPPGPLPRHRRHGRWPWTTCWPPMWPPTTPSTPSGPTPSSPPTTSAMTVYEYDRHAARRAAVAQPRRRTPRPRRVDRRAPAPALRPPPHAGRRRVAAAPGRAPGWPPTGRPGGRRRRPAGPSTPSRRARTSAPSTCSGSTTTTPGLRGTSACPATARRAGATRCPARELWDDPPDPGGLARWLGVQHALAPGLPFWVVENGLCNRLRNGRSFGRLDGWDRPRYLRENLAAVVGAVDAGVPVAGYWHWSLVDNYEWGSYEPRFGIHGVDRERGGPGRHLARHRRHGPRRRRCLPPAHRRSPGRRPLRTAAGADARRPAPGPGGGQVT